MHAIVVTGSGRPGTVTSLFLSHIYLQTSSTVLETVQRRFHVLFSKMHHRFVKRSEWLQDLDLSAPFLYMLKFYQKWQSFVYKSHLVRMMHLPFRRLALAILCGIFLRFP